MSGRASPAYRATLAAYLGPQRGRVALLGGLVLCDISLDLLGPQIQSRFLDRALAGAALAELARLALFALGVAGLVQILFVLNNYLATDIAQVGTNRLREDLLGRVLRLGPGFHQRHTPGALIERIDGDVAALGNFLSRFVLEMIGSVLLLVGALGLLWRIDPRISVLLAGFAAAALLALRRLTGQARLRWEADRAAQAELFGFLEERLAGTEDLRANGASDYVMLKYFEAARRAAARRLSAARFGALTGGSAMALLGLGASLALGMGAWLLAREVISLGSVYLIFAYSQLLQGPITAISRQVQDLQQAGASLRRIGQLQAERPEVVEVDDPRPLPGGPLALELERLSYAYPSGHRVIQAIDLRLAAGETLGLIGRSGSGKTTLTRLLFRLVEAQSGALRIGGIDIRQLSLESLRSRVALVTQDVQLFQASIRDNLSLFDPEPSEARLLEAIASVGLSDWLAAQPEGLATRLPAGGAGLSAGEAQLLALARVFLRQPGLVLLDEASSRLDPASEARLDRALSNLLEGRSAIIIAHRLTTLQRVDRIAVLEDGRLVEQGSRRRLEADPGSRYAQLLRAARANPSDPIDELLAPRPSPRGDSPPDRSAGGSA